MGRGDGRSAPDEALTLASNLATKRHRYTYHLIINIVITPAVVIRTCITVGASTHHKQRTARAAHKRLTTSSALRVQLTKDSRQAAHCEGSSQKTHDKQRTARAAHKRLTTSSALRGQLTALGAALRAKIPSTRQVASDVALHVTKHTSSPQLSHCCDQG